MGWVKFTGKTLFIMLIKQIVLGVITVVWIVLGPVIVLISVLLLLLLLLLVVVVVVIVVVVVVAVAVVK